MPGVHERAGLGGNALVEPSAPFVGTFAAGVLVMLDCVGFARPV